MQTVTVPMESLAEIILLQLENGGRAKLSVTGGSMWPVLLGGRDTVTLVSPGALKRGDIILFRRESGAYILHRIIKKTKSGYICSGDNQAIREAVTDQQVIAVVDSFVRDGREYTLDTPWYRLYTAIWVDLFFIRQFCIKACRFLGSLRRKLRRKGL